MEVHLLVTRLIASNSIFVLMKRFLLLTTPLLMIFLIFYSCGSLKEQTSKKKSPKVELQLQTNIPKKEEGFKRFFPKSNTTKK